jgi:proton-dependent oligopeptide transporter, POT family
LGSILPATGDQFKEATTMGIDLQSVLDKKIIPTAEQLKMLVEKKISTDYPSFAGFTIHNLFEFFMVFVVLCGIAAVLLFLLTPLLKKMMHGVR